MSIHVCACAHRDRLEYHLRYPGMTQEAAQELASKINSGALESPDAWKAAAQPAPVQDVSLIDEGKTAAQRQWVGLTDEEKRQIFEREDYQGWLDYINAIEAKLRSKNNG